VIPIINTNNNVTIAACLEDSTHIKGQHEISHPSEDGISKTVHKSDKWIPLKSPISKLYYINEYGQEFPPKTNPNVLSKISDHRNVIVYGMGSLYTSVIPSLILPGPKILLLNGKHDRETEGMNVISFIQAITNALNRYDSLSFTSKQYITHIAFTEKGEIPVFSEREKVQQLGIILLSLKGDVMQECYFDCNALASVLFNFAKCC